MKDRDTTTLVFVFVLSLPLVPLNPPRAVHANFDCLKRQAVFPAASARWPDGQLAGIPSLGTLQALQFRVTWRYSQHPDFQHPENLL